MWTDNHCHLPTESAEVIESLLDEARSLGVTRFVNVGCDLAGSRAAVASAAAFRGVFATVGVHPHEAQHGCDGIAQLAGSPGVVAIGECGLDYHYLHSPKEAQRAVFAEQIGLAKTLDLALVIHTREAWEETFDILDQEGMPARTVFHCFSGGPDEAQQCLERGAVLSFSGILTFPSADLLREAALLCPLDAMMVETDAPYLAPVPHRGRKNRPGLVSVVGESLAGLRGVSCEVLAEATSAVAERIYRFEANTVAP